MPLAGGDIGAADGRRLPLVKPKTCARVQDARRIIRLEWGHSKTSLRSEVWRYKVFSIIIVHPGADAGNTCNREKIP